MLAGVTGPVALGLALASLRRIRRTGRQGRGLALAGLWVGVATTLYLLVLVVVVVVSVADSSTGSSAWSSCTEDGAVTDAWPGDGSADPRSSEGYRLTESLFPGDCLASSSGSYDLQDAVVVDCATVHEAEVLAQVQLTGPVRVGSETEDPVWNDAYARCQTVATGLAPDVHAYAVAVDLHHPHPDEWARGRTSGYCVLSTSGGELTGSLVRGGARDRRGRDRGPSVTKRREGGP